MGNIDEKQVLKCRERIEAIFIDKQIKLELFLEDSHFVIIFTWICKNSLFFLAIMKDWVIGNLALQWTDFLFLFLKKSK